MKCILKLGAQALAILMLVVSSVPSWAQKKNTRQVLTLGEFLRQVQEQHSGFKGSSLAEEGARLRENEADLLTRPNLIASANRVDDRRETGSVFQGNELQNSTYSFGIEQNFSFGLNANLTYNMAHTELPGANATFMQTKFTTAGPALTLTQSLWRNFFGNETRATQELQSAQAEMTKYNESFRQTQLLAEAESSYWRLALAREAVEASRETHSRAVRLREWSGRRTSLQLADRSDLLLAESSLLSRQLELQMAIDEEKSASRAFNSLRGQDSGDVPEVLVEFDATAIEKLSVPQRAKFRDDVKAAEQQMRMAQATAKLGKERNKPTLNLTGSVGYNGRDTESGAAIEEGWKSDHPNYAVGVNLRVPLSFGTTSDNREGYAKEIAAAELNYHRRAFEQERLWEDLNQKFKDSVARFKIATNMEKAQKERLDHERIRHSRGRTTTFQVIQSEQDYANAQLARIRAQAEVLNSFAQLKTFADTSGGAQ